MGSNSTLSIDAVVLAEVHRRLADVEDKDSVRILYAVESGSRAWGFPSADSDCDVRFVYIRPQDWYLSVNLESRRDVIERPILDHIDLSGWDIRKALLLFAKSNPPFLEWLSSPIVYRDELGFAAAVRDLLPRYYSPVSSLYHFLRMAQGNYREFLQGPEVIVKKYFYVLRPLLAVRWIEQGRGPVPMEFTRLLVTVEDVELLRAIETLIERKKRGEELAREPAIPPISRFVVSEIDRPRAVVRPGEQTDRDLEPLSELFRRMVDASYR
ncbi:MAG TPA: nucleotidyltransferase domain-containing protein [Pirellulaceae bacterium]|nr:nucleotidyltransferase domain-containing protein [Pirellulaceae bacterium]